ncbi:MAG: DUF6624 domain-containing protein [Rudaea sp.]
MRALRVSAVLLLAALLMPICGAYAQDDATEQRAIDACPGFARWVEAHKAGARRSQGTAEVAAPSLPALRAELLAMQADDQRVRQAPEGGPPPMQPLLDVDAKHLPRIEAIVAQRGFPTRAQVGGDGVTAAWLLVQHATRDPAFQARVLKQLEPRVQTGEFGGEQFAMLIDRVLRLKAHEPQRYGSQLDYIDGKYVVGPLEDPAHVDVRRAQLRMAPLRDYVCFVNALYAPRH